MKYCEFCNKEFLDSEGFKLGGHKTHCSHRPEEYFVARSLKIRESSLGKVLSEEHKKKISQSRIKYLLENPDKVPYKLNHKHKETYPERYFKKILKGFVCQYRPEGTLYEIDFANVDKKVAIEIDGEQHYVDQRIVAHDIKRTKTLEELGWKIIRVRWSHYKKLNRQEQREILSLLMNESTGVDVKLKLFIDLKKERLLLDKQNKADIKRKQINDKIEKILSSGIDVTKFGWCEVMKRFLNQKKSPATWMSKYMPEYYSKCFRK